MFMLRLTFENQPGKYSFVVQLQQWQKSATAHADTAVLCTAVHLFEGVVMTTLVRLKQLKAADVQHLFISYSFMLIKNVVSLHVKQHLDRGGTLNLEVILVQAGREAL